ncbi:MAG: hypothetical protein WBV23_02110 [Desulfobaccales bacterium]
MKQIIATLLVIVCLWPPLVGLAQEADRSSPPPLNLPDLGPPTPEMLREMMELWRKMGPEFPLNAPMLQGLEELAKAGRLTPEARQKLADLGRRMERLATENFSPADPQNQQHYQDLINQMQRLIQGVENADKTGTGCQ